MKESESTLDWTCSPTFQYAIQGGFITFEGRSPHLIGPALLRRKYPVAINCRSPHLITCSPTQFIFYIMDLFRKSESTLDWTCSPTEKKEVGQNEKLSESTLDWTCSPTMAKVKFEQKSKGRSPHLIGPALLQRNWIMRLFLFVLSRRSPHLIGPALLHDMT